MKRFTLIALALIFGLGISVYSQEADTSKVRIGKKEYTVISDSKVKIYENDDKHNHRTKMRGTWDGLEFGLTNFMNSDYSLDLPSWKDSLTKCLQKITDNKQADHGK